MKKLLNNTNKSEWLIIGLYKVAIYMCWYLFAYIFALVLKEELTDAKLILLVIFIVIIYIIRTFLKMVYKRNANDTYYNLKHSIEMYYFRKLSNIDYAKLENVDKEELANRILKVSYNYTKIIYDIFEYLIPVFFGLFMIFVKLFDLSKIFTFIIFICLLVVLVYSYNNMDEEELTQPNYNDLLKDFIKKILTIKKLNIFSYCFKKLDKERESDLCILSNNDTINDIKLTNSLFVFLIVILISSFIFVNNTITRLGVIIFFIIIALKLQELLFKINPAIKNMFASARNRLVLDNMLEEENFCFVNNNWKKITVKDGLVNYKETSYDVKIPLFELIKKDHISIMGSSGEGKSTILNVLSGIFKMDKGNILYDGTPSLDVVDAIYISKDVTILNISLRDNLMFDNKKTDEELINLIESVNLKEWFSTLENGLDEIITADIDENIIERINILRAIISDKDIYFFDEPISKCDNDTEKKVVSLIKKHFKDKTYIIISKKTSLTNLCKKHYFIKNHTLLEKEPLL